MKLHRKEKRILAWIFVLIYGSGALLFIFGRWVRVASPVGEQHHPIENWARIAHAAAAYVVLVTLGYLLKRHILPGLKNGEHLKSGLAVLLFFGALSMTALGVLYTGDGTCNTIMVQGHDWTGLLIPLPILIHLLIKVPQSPGKSPQHAPRKPIIKQLN